MESSPEGTQTNALSGHCLLLPMVRGVYMDFDAGEMPTREFQWMVRWSMLPVATSELTIVVPLGQVQRLQCCIGRSMPFGVGFRSQRIL